MNRYICERRCDEGMRSFKGGLCGTIRTINAGGDKKLNGLLKDQSEEYSKLIRTLISMGFAYEQVVFERDVAIQQLNELGIQFGEDIQKYKVVKS